MLQWMATEPLFRWFTHSLVIHVYVRMNLHCSPKENPDEQMSKNEIQTIEEGIDKLLRRGG
jgi:hypothetical protein